MILCQFINCAMTYKINFPTMLEQSSSTCNIIHFKILIPIFPSLNLQKWKTAASLAPTMTTSL